MERYEKGPAYPGHGAVTMTKADRDFPECLQCRPLHYGQKQEQVALVVYMPTLEAVFFAISLSVPCDVSSKLA